MAKPKILFFDIETSPNLAYVWGKYQQDVIAFNEEWDILSVSWKWQGSKKIHWRRKGKTDEQLVERIAQLFAQADIVVAHNGDKFDIKKVRTRLAIHNLPPTKILATVDTLKVAKKHFAFTSNRLTDIAKVLGLGEKVETGGFNLWLGCMRNDQRSWNLMEKYNKHDVILLEKVYDRLLPHMDKHPNVSLIQGMNGCDKCGSKNVIKYGFRANPQGCNQRWKCMDCGGNFLTALTKKLDLKKGRK